MKQPIIIIGSGRAGSTIFAETLSKHEHLVYMSQLTTRVSGCFFLSRLFLYISKIPVLGRIAEKVVKIGEAYPMWDRLAQEFSYPKRNITEEDVLPGEAEKIRGKLDKLAVNRNSRLLIKITDWPRIGYLLKVFPDAKFINIVRDGRAVANSLMNVSFWMGRKGPEGWRLGPLSEEQDVLYKKHDKSVTALAGIYWNILMDSTQKDIKKYNPSIMTVKYEDLCLNHFDIMREVVEFCGLKWTKRYEKAVKRVNIQSRNYKWHKDLSENDILILNDVTMEWRNKLGYG